ncbi:hypothetical protein [Psychrobacter sp.]|uniref:hypothetical protein n=1 Tax=Psychrobacter sp. TaxID=56811 RepID=UPI002FD99EB5
MSNYTYTDAVGTSRRRAKQILINNPAQPLGATADTAMQASVTFVMEDRVVLADGKEMFVDAGNMIVPINEETLAKLYPNYDVQTGVVNEDKGNRHGATIVNMIMDGLEDVFITEGMARDNPSVMPTQTDNT